MKNDQHIDRASRKAHDYEKHYGGCSQSVLGALQEELGIGGKESFLAVSALAGGVARQGETCGAFIGALAALGLVIGRGRIEDTDDYRFAMDYAMKVSARFRADLKNDFSFKTELPNTLCLEIQKRIYGRGFNLADMKELQAFLAAGGHSDTGCPKVCAIAARVAAEVITQLQDR